MEYVFDFILKFTFLSIKKQWEYKEDKLKQNWVSLIIIMRKREFGKKLKIKFLILKFFVQKIN